MSWPWQKVFDAGDAEWMMTGTFAEQDIAIFFTIGRTEAYWTWNRSWCCCFSHCPKKWSQVRIMEAHVIRQVRPQSWLQSCAAKSFVDWLKRSYSQSSLPTSSNAKDYAHEVLTYGQNLLKSSIHYRLRMLEIKSEKASKKRREVSPHSAILVGSCSTLFDVCRKSNGSWLLICL